MPLGLYQVDFLGTLKWRQRQVVASARTLEQKISDAGPNNQRIDPHILTTVRNNLIKQDIIKHPFRAGIQWYHLTDVAPEAVAEKLDKL